MDYSTLKLTLTDGVAIITLDRPKVMNAMNTQMRAEIQAAVTWAGKKARCVVLTGGGRAFCSGQDLSDRTGGDGDPEQSLRDEYEPMLRAIFDCPVPTIAAVNGAAAGAGANLALAFDVVIASESAYFMQAFTRIGLIPDAGGTYTMPRTMGMAKAMGASLFADKITARQADDWGMIWESVADESFDAHWRGRAAYLANGPTAAFASAKTVIRGSWDNTRAEQLELEAREQGNCGRTRDFKEGVLAFMQKRKPEFEGR